MRCASHCVASEFDTQTVVEKYAALGLEPQFFDDVVYVSKKIGLDKSMDVFCFPFGAVVFWGAAEQDEKTVIEELRSCANSYMPTPTKDIIYYSLDPDAGKTFIDEESNTIVMHDPSTFIKLSISHALAQSVKLKVLEHSVNEMLKSTTHIQQELATTGTISMAKQDLSKQIGILFNERFSVNLHSDILDVPEFFWRRPNFEPLYAMTAEFQDIQVRHNIMNHRLDTIHDLYTILCNELNYRHSTRLEIIIIALITIEVFIGLLEILISISRGH